MADTKKETIRLNRYLAMCGIAARRKSEEYITTGRVKINGIVVDEPGRQVKPEDEVTFDDKPIKFVPLTYLVYNKPKGLLCAVEDSREQTIIDVLPTEMDSLKLFPVGRLDKESEGIIILTNDGMFAQELIHPRNGNLKTYEVELRYSIPEAKIKEWESGVLVDGKKLKPVSVRRLTNKNPKRCVEVVLGEGIKREIRLMVRALENRVEKLERVKIGKLKLRDLPQGEFISFTKDKLWSMIKDGGVI